MNFRPLLSAFALLTLTAPALAQSRLPMEGFADLAERLTPAVVNIATSQRVDSGAETPRFPPGSPRNLRERHLARHEQREPEAEHGLQRDGQHDELERHPERLAERRIADRRQNAAKEATCE